MGRLGCELNHSPQMYYIKAWESDSKYISIDILYLSIYTYNDQLEPMQVDDGVVVRLTSRQQDMCGAAVALMMRD